MLGHITEIARSVNGVRKVVRMFEPITEEELQQIAAQVPVAADTDAGQVDGPWVLFCVVHQTSYQTGRIPTPTLHPLHIGVELIHQGRDRQACAVAAGFVQYQA